MSATVEQGSELRTERMTAKRHPERSSHDFATIARILDAGIYCHIGFVADGQPFVVPTGYGREGRALYIHGSAASRMIKTLAQGTPMCLTVTLMDGLVMARSAFNNSINYRSVMIVGVAEQVPDDEKLHAMQVITDHIMPGRWDEVRKPAARELKLTTMLKLHIGEASAKIRSGPPVDEENDYALPIWAGVLPFALAPQAPIADERLAAGVEAPPHISDYQRLRGAEVGA